MAQEIYSDEEVSSNDTVKKVGLGNWLMLHSKKTIVFLVAFSVLISVVLIGLIIYAGGGNVVASLGDKKVLKTEYEDAKTKCDGFYKYNSDKTGQKKCSESEIEDQILRKALEIEAEKRGITVTDQEINARYQGLVSAYKSEDEYKQTIKSAYGWTPEYVKANIKRDILQEKLEPYLIGYRNVFGAFVRYDWSESNSSIEQKQLDENNSKEMLEKNLYPLMQKGVSNKELEDKVIKLQTQEKFPWNMVTTVGTVNHKTLNAKTAKARFKGTEEWEGISKLKKAGDVTGIIRSPGGYFVVYKLESVGENKFLDWEEFKKDAMAKAKIRSVSYKFKALRKTSFNEVKMSLNRVGKVFGARLVSAAETCDWGAFYGIVVSSSNTSMRIPGVSVEGFEDTGGNHGKCPGAKSYLQTFSDGSGNFKLGAAWNNDLKALDCHVGWKVRVTKAGYYELEYRQLLAKPNGSEVPLDHYLRWDAGWAGEEYTGPEGNCKGSACNNWGNGNNNSYIALTPKPNALTLNKTGTGDGNFSGSQSGAYTWGTFADFTAQPDATSVFDGWTGGVPAWTSGAGNWEWGNSKFLSVDYNGDGKKDIAAFYNYGDANTGLILFTARSDGSGYSASNRVWLSGTGKWDWNRSVFIPTERDGKTDITAFYDYGGNNMGLWIFKAKADGTGYDDPQRKWLSQDGGRAWNMNNTKFVPVDYNGDGKTDIAAYYNLGGSNTGLYLFTARPFVSGYQEVPGWGPGDSWTSGAGKWDWNRSVFIPTDYDGDGKIDITAFYDYGGNNMGHWVFKAKANGTGYDAPVLKWQSLSNGRQWNMNSTKFIPVDYNGDGKTDIAGYYNFGGASTNLYLFAAKADGTGYDISLSYPSPSWQSFGGNWDWNSSMFVPADYNGDGKTDIGAFYNYGGAFTRLWIFGARSGSGYEKPGIWPAHGHVWMDSDKAFTAIFNRNNNLVSSDPCSFDASPLLVNIGLPIALSWDNTNVDPDNVKNEQGTIINIPVGKKRIQVVPIQSTKYTLLKGIIPVKGENGGDCPMPGVTVTPNSSSSVQPVAP